MSDVLGIGEPFALDCERIFAGSEGHLSRGLEFTSRRAIASGSSVLLSSHVQCIAVGDDAIYFGTDEGAFRIGKSTVNIPTPIASGKPKRMALDQSHVYWTDTVSIRGRQK